MAKNISQKKGRQKDQHPQKERNELHFIFTGYGENKPDPEYIDEFASKVNSENSSITTVYCLHKKAVEEDKEKLAEITQKGGYAVLMANSSLSRQFNPNEFSRLPLSGESDPKVYYEFSFKGKETVRHAGLIVPAQALNYLVTLLQNNSHLDAGLIDVILQKLGFHREEITLHQDAPFDMAPSRSKVFWKKVKLNLAWNTTLPFKEVREPSFWSLFPIRENPLFRLAFFATALAIFVILPHAES